MPKRKRDDTRPNFFLPLLLGLGLVILAGFSIWTLTQFIPPQEPPSSSPTAIIIAATPDQQSYTDVQDAVAANHVLPFIKIPPTAKLILSTRNGDILASTDGKSFMPTGLRGKAVTASRDGQS